MRALVTRRSYPEERRELGGQRGRGGQHAGAQARGGRQRQDNAARLAHEQVARRVIPLREAVLVEGVEPAGRDPREVERGRAGAADVARQGQHAAEDRRLQPALVGDVGEARADERARERRRLADPQRRAVEPAALAARRAERLAAHRVVHDRDERADAVAAGDRDGPLRDAVEEVDGAVERVDDPLEPALAHRARALLADQAVAGALGPQHPA